MFIILLCLLFITPYKSCNVCILHCNICWLIIFILCGISQPRPLKAFKDFSLFKVDCLSPYGQSPNPSSLWSDHRLSWSTVLKALVVYTILWSTVFVAPSPVNLVLQRSTFPLLDWREPIITACYKLVNQMCLTTDYNQSRSFFVTRNQRRLY